MRRGGGNQRGRPSQPTSTQKNVGRGTFQGRRPSIRQYGYSERRPRIEGDIDGIAEVVLPNELLSYKREHPDTDDENAPKTELEVRFSYGVEYPITARLFHSIKTEIVRNWNLAAESIIEETTEVENYQNRDVRKIDDKYQHKNEVNSGDEKTYFSPDYPYKVALSIEKPATQQEIEKRGARTRNVVRKRVSYHLGVVRVDCTAVKDKSQAGNRGTEYQVELEILDAGTSEEDTNNIRDNYLAPLLAIVLETPILYTLKTLNALKRSPPFEYQDQGSKNLSADKPEDLRIHELAGVENGLVATEKYAITIKTDGLRKLFYVFRDSIYLVGTYSGNIWSFSRVYRKEGSHLPMQGTLIDCELIEDYGVDKDENSLHFYSENAHYKLWAFDILSYRKALQGTEGKGDLEREELVICVQAQIPFLSTDESVDSRYTILKKRCTQIAGKRFTLNCKNFIPCFGPESFFSACREILDQEYSFGTDGLIFTNALRPYTTVTTTEKVTSTSYNRKWKPVKRLTNDFQVAVDNNGKKILLIADYELLLPFRGTNTFSWDGKFISELDGKQLEEGEIVEFAYLAQGEDPHDNTESADDAERQLVPIKKRPDKNKPSNKKAAEDVWNLLHDPIRVATIRGESYQLMRRYNNKLKDNLLGELPQHSLNADGGSGQGGDIRKWTEDKLRVVGFEVDPVQRQRFMDRLRSLYTSKRKRKIPFDPQDIRLEEFGIDNMEMSTKYGDPPRFDSATLFFVVTFLHGDSLVRFADNMQNVVKGGGKVYILGFDARVFASKLPGYQDALILAKNNKKNIKLSYDSPATIFRINDDVVDLHLKGTLVGTPEQPQREFAVDYDELILLLEERGFHLDENSFAVEETFLGGDENKYTQSIRILRLTKGVDADIILPNADELQLPSLPAVNLIRYIMTDTEGEVETEEEEGLLPLSEGYLVPDAIAKFDYLGYTLARIGVPDDSNCLIHAACRAISESYTTMDIRERKEFVRELRAEMADDLTQDLFDSLGNGSVAALYTLQQFQKHLKTKRRVDGVLIYAWLGEEFLDLFERVFEVEIIMLWYTEENGMIPGIASAHAKEYNKTIIILNLGNFHYETIALEHKGKLWTCFKSIHPLVRLLRDRVNISKEKQITQQAERVSKAVERVKASTR